MTFCAVLKSLNTGRECNLCSLSFHCMFKHQSHTKIESRVCMVHISLHPSFFLLAEKLKQLGMRLGAHNTIITNVLPENFQCSIDFEHFTQME